MTTAKQMVVKEHAYSAAFNLFLTILMVTSTLRLGAFDSGPVLTYTGFGLAALAAGLLCRNLFYLYRIWRTADEG